MANARLMYANLITAASLFYAVSSQATGAITKVQKQGQGAGTMVAIGGYSGSTERDYVITIDGEGTGAIGSATFKWSDTGGASINASGVPTSTGAIALSNGVSIQFVDAPGQDFYLNDQFLFKGLTPYGPARLLDMDRDTEWRSADVAAAVTLDIDLASAKKADALVILDHNFTSGATIQIQGSTVSNFSSTPVNETIPWASGKIMYYLTTSPRSYRYWRLKVTDTSNPAGYLRMSSLYLGPYLELLAGTFNLGERRSKVRMAPRQQMASGRWSGGLVAMVEQFEIEWSTLQRGDRDSLMTAFSALNDLTNHLVLPILFTPDAAVLADIFLCEWEGAGEWDGDRQYPDIYRVPIRLTEVPRTI